MKHFGITHTCSVLRTSDRCAIAKMLYARGARHPLVRANAKELLRFLSYSVWGAHLIMTKRFIYAVSCRCRAFFVYSRIFILYITGLPSVQLTDTNISFRLTNELRETR